MDEADREATTPRITHTWSNWSSKAADIASKARGVEAEKGRIGAGLDVRGQRLARAVRVSAEWYVEAFAKWATEEVPHGQKQRELVAFERFCAWACPELGIGLEVRKPVCEG